MALLSCKFSNTEMHHLNIQNVCLHRMIRTSLSWFLSTNRCSFTHQNICERFMCDSIDSIILCIRSRAVDSMKPVFDDSFPFKKINERVLRTRESPSISLLSLPPPPPLFTMKDVFLPSSISVVTTSQIRIEWCIVFRVADTRNITRNTSSAVLIAVLICPWWERVMRDVLLRVWDAKNKYYVV